MINILNLKPNFSLNIRARVKNWALDYVTYGV